MWLVWLYPDLISGSVENFWFLADAPQFGRLVTRNTTHYTTYDNVQSGVTEVHQSSWAVTTPLLAEQTPWCSGGRDDGLPFLILLCRKATSPAYVVTIAIHAGISVMSGPQNPIWLLANDSADAPSFGSDLRDKLFVPAVALMLLTWWCYL